MGKMFINHKKLHKIFGGGKTYPFLPLDSPEHYSLSSTVAGAGVEPLSGPFPATSSPSSTPRTTACSPSNPGGRWEFVAKRVGDSMPFFLFLNAERHGRRTMAFTARTTTRRFPPCAASYGSAAATLQALGLTELGIFGGN